MRTKILLLLFLCAALQNVNAYIPMLNDDNVWNFPTQYFPMHGESEGPSTEQYRINGDSVINGVTYKKIISSYSRERNDWKVSMLMREDIDAERVYTIYPGEQEERLLYNFSLEKGDTIRSKWENYLYDDYIVEYYIITAIDTILNGIEEKCRKYTITELEPYSINTATNDTTFILGSWTCTWIEGVGSLRNIFDPCSKPLPGAASIYLSCLMRNDELIFKENSVESISDCEVWEKTEVKVRESGLSPISCTVNPMRTTLEISAESTAVSQIRLIDVNGRTVSRESINGMPASIDISKLPTGVYIVQLLDDGNIVAVEKIIK